MRVPGRRSALLSCLGVTVLLASLVVAVQLRPPVAYAADPARPGFLAYTGSQDEDLVSVDVTPPVSVDRVPDSPPPSPPPGPVIRMLPVAAVAAAAAPPEPFVANPGLDNQAAGRADGSLVYVHTGVDPDGDLYLRAADGTTRRLFAHPGREWDPAWSPDGRQVAFAAGPAGARDIWVVGVDGTGLRRITAVAADDTTPTWSPQGDRIAFTSARGNRRGRIYLTAAAGGGAATAITQPPGGAADLHPAWSPDGERIAFTREAGEDSDILTVSPAGGSARILFGRDGWPESHPAWSPDGERIAFRADIGDGVVGIRVGFADGEGDRLELRGPDVADPTWTDDNTLIATVTGAEKDVWGIRPDGTDRHDISRRRDDDDTPAYSPDGKLIAYSQAKDKASSIVVANADGTGARVITNTAGTAGVLDTAPTWSPDGRRLAFQRFADRAAHIWTVRADGTGAQDISAGNLPAGTADSEPAWSPDGERIAFVSEDHPDADIWLMRTDGSGRVQVTADEDPTGEFAAELADRHPSWSPGSDRLVFSRTRSDRNRTFLFLASAAPGGATSSQLTGNAGPESFGPDDFHPAWSPDGTRIAFSRGLNVSDEGRFYPNLDLWTVAVAGRDEVQITELEGQEEQPSWQPVADLRIAAAAPAEVQTGERFVYTITVGNGGLVESPGVTVTDPLPAEVELTGAVPSQGRCAAGPPLVCELGPLRRGGTASVRVAVTAKRPGLLVNTATVGGPIADPDPVDNTATVRTAVRGTDLAVTGTDAPDPAEFGQPVDYRLTVTQRGPDAARDVVLQVAPPAGATVVSARPAEPDGRCRIGGTGVRVRCAWPRLDRGQADQATRSVSVVVRPARPGRNAVTATVTSATGELNRADNTTRIETEVLGTDLSAGLTVTPTTAYVGGKVTVRAVVTNQGGSPAAGARLLVRLPGIVCPPPAGGGACPPPPPATGSGTGTGTGTAASPDPTLLTLPLGDIPAGGVVRREVVVLAVAVGSGTIQVAARSDTPDVDPADNGATAVLRVLQPALELAPPIGPPGFVALVRGTDFPPGTDVTLTWKPGITPSTAPVRVSPDGTFTAQMLVIRRDLQGKRRLVASGPGFGELSTDFLVVSRTVSPLGFLSRN